MQASTSAAAIPSDLVVEWKNILPVDPTYAARKPRKIDTKLSFAAHRPSRVRRSAPDPTTHLAVRQHASRKARSASRRGQQVAKAMRMNVFPTRRSASAAIRDGAAKRHSGSTSCEVELPPYNAERLGPVGGRIMTQVLVGLLQRDRTPAHALDPAWKPGPPIAPAPGVFTFVDLLRYAGAA